MHKLGKHYSPPFIDIENPDGKGSTTYHILPPSHVLPADMETDLRNLGFGYRAKFIESSLASLRARFGSSPGDIESGLRQWRLVDADEVRNNLLELKGIGPKVADCVMLMSLDQVSHLVASR